MQWTWRWGLRREESWRWRPDLSPPCSFELLRSWLEEWCTRSSRASRGSRDRSDPCPTTGGKPTCKKVNLYSLKPAQSSNPEIIIKNLLCGAKKLYYLKKKITRWTPCTRGTRSCSRSWSRSTVRDGRWSFPSRRRSASRFCDIPEKDENKLFNSVNQ